MNNHADVAEETRQRVHDAAKHLNYHPNISARGLVTGRSGIVGLILPGVPHRSVAALHMELVGRMSAHFARHGMHFMLHVSDETENMVSVYRRLISGNSLDGLVIFAPLVKDPRIAFLKAQGFPFVVHGRTEPEPDYPYFDIDNEWVGYTLTRQLVDAGHRDIAFLNGAASQAFAEARRRGYQRALAEAGIEYRAEFHRGGLMEEGFGLRETTRLLDKRGRKPTGFIASNALIARGIIAAARAFDLTVPGDVSVVAHDDMLPGLNMAQFDPALTATQSALEHSWKPLAEFLVGAVRGQPVAELQEVEVPELVIRDSVLPPPVVSAPVPA